MAPSGGIRAPKSGHINGKRRGVAVHAAVAELACHPTRSPAAETITRVAGRHAREIAVASIDTPPHA